MAKIVTVFNQKGGCAKSMTSMQLAGACALRGYKAVVVDMDPQGTATIWASVEPAKELKLTGFPAEVRSLAPLGRGMVRSVAGMVDDFDLIVIDTPPAVESESPWAALQISDLGIIPFVPTPADHWARDARLLAKKAMAENPDITGIWHLPSMVRRGKVIDGVLQAFRDDQEIKLMKSIISLRNAYLNAQANGVCVSQMAPSSDAGKEMAVLVDEVLGLLGLPKQKPGKRGK